MVTLDATLSRVQAEAKQIDIRKVLLVLLLILPAALAWTVRMLWRATAWTASFVIAAGKVGWDAAAPKQRVT